MTTTEVLNAYLQHLENGKTEAIISLFSKDGMVDSPIYGIQKADQFYKELGNDTSNSKLQLKGIFEQNGSKNFALYFNYLWTLNNGKHVEFDVVDIIELNSEHKITKLKIIYDTVVSRTLIHELKHDI